MQILNQWAYPTCANYAVMGILDRKWIKCDMERLWKIRVPYYHQVEELFRKEGLVKEFITIPTQKQAEIWLRKWEPLLTSTSRWDFTLEDNVLGLVEFDERSQHFFIIIGMDWDLYKCQNSWWEWWGENGYFHIKKSDYKFLFTPRRIITK